MFDQRTDGRTEGRKKRVVKSRARDQKFRFLAQTRREAH